MTADLGKIRCPVLGFWGMDDQLMPVGGHEKVLRALRARSCLWSPRVPVTASASSLKAPPLGVPSLAPAGGSLACRSVVGGASINFVA